MTIDTNKAREIAGKLLDQADLRIRGDSEMEEQAAALLLAIADERDRDAKDAARYRWLRNNHSKRIWNHVLDDDLKDRTSSVDAAIDAAMGESNGLSDRPATFDAGLCRFCLRMGGRRGCWIYPRHELYAGAQMDDLTIVRLCAEAMELPEIQPYRGNGIGYRCRPGEHEWLAKYDPLHDDAQLAALIKKFQGNARVMHAIDLWQNFYEPDLNRAICLAVATMQEASGG